MLPSRQSKIMLFFPSESIFFNCHCYCILNPKKVWKEIYSKCSLEYRIIFVNRFMYLFINICFYAISRGEDPMVLAYSSSSMYLISLYWLKRIIDVTAETFKFKYVLQVLWSRKTNVNISKSCCSSIDGDLPWLLYLLELRMPVIYLTFTPVLRTFFLSVSSEILKSLSKIPLDVWSECQKPGFWNLMGYKGLAVCCQEMKPSGYALLPLLCCI